MRTIFSVIVIALATLVPSVVAGPADEARQIAALAGFHGGLVVHVGCGDGKLTAALRLAENCVVQGLETDAKRVETAREAIRAARTVRPGLRHPLERRRSSRTSTTWRRSSSARTPARLRRTNCCGCSGLTAPRWSSGTANGP